jgi:hypothetical protein
VNTAAGDLAGRTACEEAFHVQIEHPHPVDVLGLIELELGRRKRKQHDREQNAEDGACR